MANPFAEEVQELIRDRGQTAFLVDFDGTLVDIAPHPDHVHTPGSVMDDIRVIAQRGEPSFAIVTGRAMSRLDKLLGFQTVAVCSHGAEIRLAPDAQSQAMVRPLALSLREAVRAVNDSYNGFFEDKGYSLSVHLPVIDSDKDITDEIETALGGGAGACIVRRVGRTYEIMQRGVSKGSGIRYLMTQPGFAGRRPVYIGDDVFSDDSLRDVTDIGGVLLPVHHHNYGQQKFDAPVMQIDDVRDIVAALAR